MVNVKSVSSVYMYKTNRKSWQNPGKANVYCLSYQSYGHYDHTFSFDVLSVKSDTLFLIAKNQPYSVKCVEQGESMCVTFDAELNLNSSVYDCKDHPEIKNLFQKLMTYKNLNSEINCCEVISIIYKLLAFIYKKNEPLYVGRDIRTKIQNVHHYLTEHYADNELKIINLAKQNNISPKYLRILFKKMYNTTPTQYIISLRMQRALKLLGESNLPISRIAEMSGFSDVYYFSKLFKARFSCSPGEYRNNYDDTKKAGEPLL